MLAIEQKIIDAFTFWSTLHPRDYQGESGEKKLADLDAHRDILLQEAMALPFDSLSDEFLNHPVVHQYFNNIDQSTTFAIERNCLPPFFVWLLIGHYFSADADKKTHYWNKIQAIVLASKQKMNDHTGQGLFKEFDRFLIKNIYLSKDPALIKLFQDHLPIPGHELFEGGPLPSNITPKSEIQAAIDNFFRLVAEWGVDKEQAISKITARQRLFRSKQRPKEECQRIRANGSSSDVITDLKDASTPYFPQKCPKELAQRIFEESGSIELFHTIRHLTSETYLDNILDDAGYGQSLLLKKYKPFKRSALEQVDLAKGGDAKVICFGPHEIDSSMLNPEEMIEITLDLNKFNDADRENPCMFYKQKDLGFFTKALRSVPSLNLKFCHTREKKGVTNLEFFTEGDASPYAGGEPESAVPNHLFISYNIKQMQQILILNFFRLLDKHISEKIDNFDSIASMTAEQREALNRKPDAAYVYYLLGQLNREQLRATLKEIGLAISSTAEVNFYEAYKFDLATIKSFKNKLYTLELSAFIEALRSGNRDELDTAIRAMPTLFKSYRFVDYVLSQSRQRPYPEPVFLELLRLKDLCKPLPFVNSPQSREEGKAPPPAEDTAAVTLHF